VGVISSSHKFKDLSRLYLLVFLSMFPAGAIYGIFVSRGHLAERWFIIAVIAAYVSARLTWFVAERESKRKRAAVERYLPFSVYSFASSWREPAITGVTGFGRGFVGRRALQDGNHISQFNPEPMQISGSDTAVASCAQN
jgi:hypothetical protein